MRQRIFTPLVLLFSFAVINAYSQCEPDIQGCPDPEMNGEICPDSLASAVLEQGYAEVVTILVPDKPTDTSLVELHHITLVDIQNLPPGLSWQSNAAGNEFLAENYYCVLIEGTPTLAGTFYLKIIVDVFVDFGGLPIYVGQQVDSTSVYMEVIDPFFVDEFPDDPWIIADAHPNPFTGETIIKYSLKDQGPMDFEIFSMTGQRVHAQSVNSNRGENRLIFNGQTIVPGIYLFRLSSGSGYSKSMVVIRK